MARGLANDEVAAELVLAYQTGLVRPGSAQPRLTGGCDRYRILPTIACRSSS